MKRRLLVVLILLLAAGFAGCVEEQVGLETEVTYYEPYPLAFYNVFYELEMPDTTFEVKNPTNDPVTVRLTSEYQGYSNPVITMETIMPGEMKMINHTIPLIKEKIEQIKTKTKFSLYYKIEYMENGQWKVWDEQTVMVDVYPKDTMVWAMVDNEGNLEPLHEYIVVFVTPKVDAIQNELLPIAKEYAVDDFGSYTYYGLYRSLPGYQYQGYSDEDWTIYTALQIKAIYNALQDYGMSYVSTPIAFGHDARQKVRLPRETLETLSGNCIDGAILFASAIEALGMNPYIVIIPGHAFVAWDINEEGRYIDALETTMVGYASFEEAWERGQQELEKYWDALFDDDPWNGLIIDVKALHEAGILPME